MTLPPREVADFDTLLGDRRSYMGEYAVRMVERTLGIQSTNNYRYTMTQGYVNGRGIEEGPKIYKTGRGYVEADRVHMGKRRGGPEEGEQQYGG